MTNPITGPFIGSKMISVNAAGSLYDIWNRYKQPAPYDLPAPYMRQRISCLTAMYYGPHVVPNSSFNACSTFYAFTRAAVPDLQSAFSNESRIAMNKAVSAFREDGRREAMLAVNWAERKRTMDMITNRLLSIYRFARAVKRRDVAGIAAFFRRWAPDKRSKYSKRRAIPKQFGKAWLELHFGWEPLMRDIQSLISILSHSPPESRSVRVRVKVPIKVREFVNYESFYLKEYATNDTSGYVKCEVGATVAITDYNLVMASELGLTDPIAVLYELTPWSFVVDWFSTLGDWLRNNSWAYGISLKKTYATTVIRVNTTFRLDVMRNGIPSWTQATRSGVYHGRGTDIPNVVLRTKQFSMSPIRALTACSLLVGFLSSNRPRT